MLRSQVYYFYSVLPVDWLLAYKHCHHMLLENCNIICEVAEVAVIGAPDEILGERVCACIAPRPGETVTLEEIIAFLKEKKIAVFKLPERLLLLAALPRNPVGKILKHELREQLKQTVQVS